MERRFIYRPNIWMEFPEDLADEGDEYDEWVANATSEVDRRLFETPGVIAVDDTQPETYTVVEQES